MFPSLPILASFPSQPFKRAQHGLFHGKTKLSGNSVPFSKGKIRRTWLPNIQSKRLFSAALGEHVKVKVTTRALKIINKYGGFDQYVLRTKADLLGWEGMRLRVKVEEGLARANEAAKEGTSSREETAEAAKGAQAVL